VPPHIAFRISVPRVDILDSVEIRDPLARVHFARLRDMFRQLRTAEVVVLPRLGVEPVVFGLQ
jgi:hypothetical protein